MSKKYIKSWACGEIELTAQKQIDDIMKLPFVNRMAIMPDVHMGKGAVVGSVIPTENVIIPAAVGCDIGCGMIAVKLNISIDKLPDNLKYIRFAIEAAVPHGRSHNAEKGNDIGGWKDLPLHIQTAWMSLSARSEYQYILEKYPHLSGSKINDVNHLGTLGTGNHFIEICKDQNNDVWIMIHSGSRGIGSAIGNLFVKLAKDEMKRWYINLTDTDLAYLPEGSKYFWDYYKAMMWAQDYAYWNRKIMLSAVLKVIQDIIPDVYEVEEAINCHHNYVSRETFFGKEYFITRKGAIAAHQGQLGIIPGSMGAKSFIVEGKGNTQSFCSCSHGAGRTMSRTAAKNLFTVEDLIDQTKGIECRHDSDVIDEIPAAYKNIDDVMKAQEDLVSIKYNLNQLICVKG